MLIKKEKTKYLFNGNRTFRDVCPQSMYRKCELLWTKNHKFLKSETPRTFFFYQNDIITLSFDRY